MVQETVDLFGAMSDRDWRSATYGLLVLTGSPQFDDTQDRECQLFL